MTMLSFSRRQILAGTATFGAMAGTALSGLSAFGTAHGIPFGAAVRSDALASDPAYRQAVIDNCQMIVAEGEMKWPDIHPERDKYRFEKADAIAAFARRNNMSLRGHTLAWYGGMPEWTEALASRREAERELIGHIETVVSRYRDVISSWDVVNEPLVDHPVDARSLRPSIWTRRLGAEYLPIALRATAAVDPKTRLVINEYDIEFMGLRYAAKRRALLQLLRTLRDRGVPLHAVGLQAHLFADRTIDRDGLQEFLSEVAALRLDVLITELDVVDFTLPGPIEKRDALVAKTARDFLETVCAVARPKAIVTWGLSDRYTWVPIYFTRRDGMPNRPLPMDAELHRKPLFDVIDDIRRRFA
jgi:endo-1,4-beta-xylanase